MAIYGTEKEARAAISATRASYPKPVCAVVAGYPRRTHAAGSGNMEVELRWALAKKAPALSHIDRFELDIEFYNSVTGKWSQLGGQTQSSPTTSASGPHFMYLFDAPDDVKVTKLRMRVRAVPKTRSVTRYYYKVTTTRGTSANGKASTKTTKTKTAVTQTVAYFAASDYTAWAALSPSPAVADSNDARAKLSVAKPAKPAAPVPELLGDGSVKVSFDKVDPSTADTCRVVYRCADGEYSKAGARLSGHIQDASAGYFVDSKAAPGHEYRYYARSHNKRTSVASKSLSFSGALSGKLGYSVDTADARVTVSISPPLLAAYHTGVRPVSGSCTVELGGSAFAKASSRDVGDLAIVFGEFAGTSATVERGGSARNLKLTVRVKVRLEDGTERSVEKSATVAVPAKSAVVAGGSDGTWDDPPSLPADLSAPVATLPLPALNAEAWAFGEDGVYVTFEYRGYRAALSGARVHYSKDKGVLAANRESCPGVDVGNLKASRMTAAVTGLEPGTWYFAVCLSTSAGSVFGNGSANDAALMGSFASCTVATVPEPPTLLGVPPAAYLGETVEVGWVHNDEEGSAQTAAQLAVAGTLASGGSYSRTYGVTTASSVAVELPASALDDTAVLRVRARTKGASEKWSDWSEEAALTVYAKPAASLSIASPAGEGGDYGLEATSLPLTLALSVEAATGALSQRVVQWAVTMRALGSFEYSDRYGNDAVMTAGSVACDVSVGSHEDDFSQPSMTLPIAATQAVFSNGEPYELELRALMDSGLEAEPATLQFSCAFGDGGMPGPSAVVEPTEDWGARIYPSVVEPREVPEGDDYVIDRDVIRLAPLGEEGEYSIEVAYSDGGGGELTWAGEWNGTDPDLALDGMDGWASVGSVRLAGPGGEEELRGEAYPDYSQDDSILLSVYRVGQDGALSAVAEGLPNGNGVFVYDRHPSFGRMTYRVVANDTATDEVAAADVTGENDWSGILIQWAEAAEAYSGSFDEDDDSELGFAFEHVELPWDIGIQQSSAKDVALKRYPGRKHPVALYGTQVGETGSWSCDIVKWDDDLQLAQLRKLAAHMGDCWVRETSGLSYPASVDVEIARSHDSAAVNVRLEVTRVDGD